MLRPVTSARLGVPDRHRDAAALRRFEDHEVGDATSRERADRALDSRLQQHPPLGLRVL